MFQTAQLKLTAWYLIITFLISSTFSVALYTVLVREVVRFDRQQRTRIEQQLGFLPQEYSQTGFSELIEESKHTIMTSLIIVNVSVIVLAGSLGYFLASRSLKPIEDMVEEQKRFISDASHELKTPLTSLKTALEVYIRSKKKTHKEADMVIHESLMEVNSLQTLAESLLELVQYQKPNGTIPFAPVELHNVINSALRRIKPLAQKKHIRITATATTARIQGNMHALTDLFTILLDNAVTYSPHKSNITVHTTSDKNSIRVTVADQGIGIAKKDLLHIVERFYRADTVRTKKYSGGYGLGLSIAQEIVAKHKGTISARSNQKGSSFEVRLPLKQL